MHVIITRYAGMAGKIGEAAPKVQQGFVPMLKGQPGFQGYAAFASEQGDIIACAIWESAAAAANSRNDVRGWVRRNLPGFMEPTERFSGPVGPHAIVSPQSGGPGQSLHCMVRKAEDLPPSEVQRPVVEEMLAAVRKVPGFRGAYWLRSEDDPSRGASVLFCDTREHAHAAHEAALAVMREHQPNVAVRVAASGQTSVLAMA
jgi:heme-degrading monooxygenase HmoA